VNELLLPLVGIVVSIAVLAGVATSYALTRVSPTRRRLAGMSTLVSSGVISDAPALAGNPEATVKKLSTFIPKSPKEMGRVQRRLAMAGFHGARPLTVYVVCELVLALVGFFLLTVVFGRSGWLLGTAAAFMGYMLPSFYVQFRISKRQKEIRNGLADALDLLIVCLEAGLGIDQAILKAAEELGIPYPALGEELRMVNVETRAGKPRIEAFRNFARRTQVDDVRSLVAMLIQTDKFGTSVAQALRTFAEVSRTKRRQRAEEKAAKLGVKLVFPLVFCLFPAFFVISMGAAVIKLIHLFANTRPFGG
jgi:tight adherence protein C